MASSSCFCGTFEIFVEGSFGDVRYCHCSQCRMKSGTAFSANARLEKSQFRIEGPKHKITEFEYKAGMINAFCSKCGTPLYAYVSTDPDGVRVRLGGFQGEIDVNIVGHVWISSKANWYEIRDDLPIFQERFEEGKFN